MVLQNHNTVVARSTLTPNSSSQNFGSQHPAGTPNGSGTGRSPLNAGPSTQRPIIDLLVAMVAVPVLILCALQLEKNLRDNSVESRWLVFALGIGMLVISVIICGYVTHRMGVCIWAGPIDEAGNRATNGAMPHVSAKQDVYGLYVNIPLIIRNNFPDQLPERCAAHCRLTAAKLRKRGQVRATAADLRMPGHQLGSVEGSGAGTDLSQARSWWIQLPARVHPAHLGWKWWRGRELNGTNGAVDGGERIKRFFPNWQRNGFLYLTHLK